MGFLAALSFWDFLSIHPKSIPRNAATILPTIFINESQDFALIDIYWMAQTACLIYRGYLVHVSVTKCHPKIYPLSLLVRTSPMRLLANVTHLESGCRTLIFRTQLVRTKIF